MIDPMEFDALSTAAGDAAGDAVRKRIGKEGSAVVSGMARIGTQALVEFLTQKLLKTEFTLKTEVVQFGWGAGGAASRGSGQAPSAAL